MKTKLTIFIALVILFLPGYVFGDSVLTKIIRSDSRNKTQLFFVFDNLPRYKNKISGKRVDISFENTSFAEDLKLFSTDNRIVKILPLSETGSTFTFYLRYNPQNLTVTKKDNILVVDILPGNSYTKAFSQIDEQLEGVSVVQRDTEDYSNPLIASPYAYNWKSFFREYESPIKIDVPVSLTLPPFPVAALLTRDNDYAAKNFSEEAQSQAEQQLWGVLLLTVQQKLLTEKELIPKQLLALTYGEILLRDGNFEGAYKQLYLLDKEYGKEQVGIFAKYLLNMLIAMYQDPFLGEVKIDAMADDIHPRSLLAPYYQLSKIELALATRNSEKLLSLLQQDNIGFPVDVEKIKEMRMADYYSLSNQPIKAFVSYSLVEDQALIESHSFSLNGLCTTQYEQKLYEQASDCYTKLLDLVQDKEILSLVSFRQAMSDLKHKPITEVIDSFSRIEDAYPGTDAGFKAAIKKVDLMTLSKDKWDDFSGEYYRALSDKALTKDTAEEAALKEAINYAIMGQDEKALNLAMIFLRDYRSGKLTETGEALVIDLLPKEIERLVQDKRYADVIVLARQNRKLFTNNWVDIRLLADLAEAFNKLGIYKETERLYLYLIDILKDEEKQSYYLPLLQTIFIQGDYDLIKDYAEQYFFNYPDGQDSNAIKLILLKALFEEKKYQQAIDSLPSPLPTDAEFTSFLGSLYYQAGKYEKVIETLDEPYSQGRLKDVIDEFYLADSLFYVGRLDKAKTLFENLLKKAPQNQQYMYRLALIAKNLGNQEESLKYLNTIVETEQNSLWKDAAKNELRIIEFDQDFSKTRKKL